MTLDDNQKNKITGQYFLSELDLALLKGDIALFVHALGKREDDSAFQQAVKFVNGEQEVETYNDTYEEKYITMPEKGISFLLIDGLVDTVFVYAEKSRNKKVYDRSATLIDGIDFTVSPDDIVRAFGDPLRSTGTYLTYKAGPGYVQFDFNDESLRMVVLMRKLIGGLDSQNIPVEEQKAVVIEGDLATFISAVGCAMYSPEHLAAIVLAGPAMEIDEDIHKGTQSQYQYFSNNGVTLQFKGGTLVVAMIELRADDGNSVYSWPERLITGLPLPKSREAVRVHLGKPSSSHETMDLFVIDGRYVRIDFEDDETTTVTILVKGVDGSAG